MSVNNQLFTAEVLVPKVFIATGTTPTEVAAAVATQVNTLIKLQRTPAQGQTTGAVANDTITTMPMQTTITSQGILTYQVAVQWRQWVTPS